MTSEAAAVPGPAPAETGSLARLAGVIFSPGKTFESIARRPTWVPPLLLWTAIAAVAGYYAAPRLDFARMNRETFESRGQSVPAGRIESISAVQKKVTQYGGVVWPALACLVVATVYFGAFKAFGWDLKFSQALGVTTHAFVPQVLQGAVSVPIILSQESVDPRYVGDLVRSNPGFLLDPQGSKFLHSLAQSLDVFSLWSLALFVIGFSVAAKVSRKSAAAVIVTLWALYVLGKASLAAVF